MLLSDNKYLFRQIIKDAAQSLNIRESYIEKDFYAISVLKEMVKRNPNFVFKGGTSLSVCQKVINRFSEDIDIAYAEENITDGNKRKIKQNILDSIESVSLTISNFEDIRSRRSFNRYLCGYKSVLGSNIDSVIVEWTTLTPSFPVEEKTAQTIIGKHLQSLRRFDLIQEYNLEPFIVKTLTKERTLIDKVFAICDYHLVKRVQRQSRHLYDIHQLLNNVNLNNDFIILFNKVRDCRKKLDGCLSSQDNQCISYLLEELINKRTYLSDYELRTTSLLYDNVSYDECVSSIHQIIDFLKQNNL